MLITGFDPFGGEQVNPAFEAVRLLPDEIAGLELCKLEIPTEFIKSGVILKDALRAVHPNAVLCVGQAGGPHSRHAGTRSDQPDGRPHSGQRRVSADRYARRAGWPRRVFFSTLPVKAIAARIQSDGLPAAVSNTAGTYVCNSLLYTLLHTAALEYPGLRGGFLHVPYAAEQLSGKPVGTFAMPLPDIARALTRAVEAISENL